MHVVIDKMFGRNPWIEEGKVDYKKIYGRKRNKNKRGKLDNR